MAINSEIVQDKFLDKFNNYKDESIKIEIKDVLENHIWLIFIYNKSEKDKWFISKTYYTCTYKEKDFSFIEKHIEV